MANISNDDDNVMVMMIPTSLTHPKKMLGFCGKGSIIFSVPFSIFTDLY